MVVLKCCEKGLIAVICDNILRVYNIKYSKLLYKYIFSEQSETPREDNQCLNTTFSYGCAFCNSGEFLAAFSHDKDLIVWKTSETEKDWKQIGKRKVAKRPTAVLITNSKDHVVVSDKSGDVYSYSMCEGLPNETLLLGHLSIILDMAISKNDQYLITADRDEKIRVSCFPNSYNIEAFCLGHKEYVMRIMILETLPNILVSASGDGTVRFWNFNLGKAIHVESFQEKCPNKPVPIISCLACSRYNNIIFIGIKGSSMLHVYKMTEECQVKHVSDILLDNSPCSLAVDHDNHLWVIQSSEDQTVVIFEIKCEGDEYEFNRITKSPAISRLMSTEGWDCIYAGLKQLPCFEQLSKKEGYGTAEYYDRKKERIEAKTKKQKNAAKRSADDVNCLNNAKKLKA